MRLCFKKIKKDIFLQFHLCLWISSVQNKAAVFLNSIEVKTITDDFNSANGGGTLILGQDQKTKDVINTQPEESFK